MPKPTATVIVLEDNFAAVRGSITGAMLMKAAKAGGFVIEGHAKVNASRGRPGLEVQTGALMNSINVSEAQSTRTYAEVDVGPSVIYGRIHEYGGIIVPIHAPILSWVDRDTGERIIAHAVHIPARPYMRPAVDENEDDITGAVEAEIWRNIEAVT